MLRVIARASFAIAVVSALSACVIAHENTAKPISGVVVDSHSGRPLPAVAVYRMINHSKLKLVATTDSAGHFASTGADHIFIDFVLNEVGDRWNSSKLLFRAAGYKDEEIDCSPGPVPIHGSRNAIV